MHNVVICGDCGKKFLTRTIVNACSAYGGATVVDGDKIYSCGNGQRYTIFCMTTLSDLYLPDAIIVLGKALLQIRSDLSSNECVCILDSGVKSAVNFAAKTGFKAIGCSLGEHDTFGVSGYSDENTVLVSLRRNLQRSDGTFLEPMDFRVTTEENCPAYPIMAASAILLMSGISPENGLNF